MMTDTMETCSMSWLPASRASARSLRLIPLLALLTMVGSQAGLFEDDDRLMMQGAPGAVHFNSNPEHAKHSWLVGLEWQSTTSGWLAGGAYFNNSFNQKCEYLYFGKSWTLDSISNNVYFKLTGGLLLGYKDPYEDKIPVNWNGIGLGASPALGYQYGDFNVQMNLLGTAGLMFTVGYNLFK